MSEQEIKVGDTVEWESQGGGSKTTKVGEVVYCGAPLRLSHWLVIRIVKNPVIKAPLARDELERLSADVIALLQRSQHHSGAIAGDGVIVVVRRYHKRTGAELRPHTYAPRRKWLRVVKPAGGTDGE